MPLHRSFCQKNIPTGFRKAGDANHTMLMDEYRRRFKERLQLDPEEEEEASELCSEMDIVCVSAYGKMLFKDLKSKSEEMDALTAQMIKKELGVDMDGEHFHMSEEETQKLVDNMDLTPMDMTRVTACALEIINLYDLLMEELEPTEAMKVKAKYGDDVNDIKAVTHAHIGSTNEAARKAK